MVARPRPAQRGPQQALVHGLQRRPQGLELSTIWVLIADEELTGGAGSLKGPRRFEQAESADMRGLPGGTKKAKLRGLKLRKKSNPQPLAEGEMLIEKLEGENWPSTAVGGFALDDREYAVGVAVDGSKSVGGKKKINLLFDHRKRTRSRGRNRGSPFRRVSSRIVHLPKRRSPPSTPQESVDICGKARLVKAHNRKGGDIGDERKREHAARSRPLRTDPAFEKKKRAGSKEFAGDPRTRARIELCK